MIVKDFKVLLDAYIAVNFTGDDFADDEAADNISPCCAAIAPRMLFDRPQGLIASAFNFDALFDEQASETFSEMLMRLVDESGEKPSAIYKRAEVDRQIFSRIRNNKDYQPSKDTVISFAFALKLDLPKTKELLETAGYALTNSSKRDLIISFFIEKKEFDLLHLNEILYDYGQPVLLKR